MQVVKRGGGECECGSGGEGGGVGGGCEYGSVVVKEEEWEEGVSMGVVVVEEEEEYEKESGGEGEGEGVGGWCEYGSGGKGGEGGRGEARKASASTGVLRRQCISMTLMIKRGMGLVKRIGMEIEVVKSRGRR